MRACHGHCCSLRERSKSNRCEERRGEGKLVRSCTTAFTGRVRYDTNLHYDQVLSMPSRAFLFLSSFLSFFFFSLEVFLFLNSWFPKVVSETGDGEIGSSNTRKKKTTLFVVIPISIFGSNRPIIYLFRFNSSIFLQTPLEQRFARSRDISIAVESRREEKDGRKGKSSSERGRAIEGWGREK